MAGRSRRPVNPGMAVFALMVCLVPPCAWAGELSAGASSKSAPAVMVNALAREIAFVRSFSASYPCQFGKRKGDRGKKNAVAVEDMGAPKE